MGDNVDGSVSITKETYIRAFNGFLGCSHAASLFGIWGYGNLYLESKSSSTFTVDISPWYSLKNVTECADNNFAKDSFGEPVTIGHSTVDVFDFCIAFAAISATYHFIIVLLTFYGEGDGGLAVMFIETWINPLRWIDYGLSTPLMGVVLYAAYGIRSSHALLTQAVGFTGLQCFGALTEVVNERVAASTKSSKNPYIRPFYIGIQTVLLAAGFGILIVLFWPLFETMLLLQKADGDPSKPRIKSSPPPSVTAFTAVILLFYASFGFCALYAIIKAFQTTEATNVLKAQYTIDKVYGACSVMAKTVLHWGLAFVVLGQDDMVSDTRFEDPHIRCQPPGEGVQGGWSALIGVSLTAILFGIVTLFLTVLPPVSAQNTLVAMAFKGEGTSEALL